MTTQTEKGNPAGRLERLAKCQKIRASGEEGGLICANDGIGLLPTVRGLAHNPVEIRRLRDAATGWPK